MLGCSRAHTHMANIYYYAAYVDIFSIILLIGINDDFCQIVSASLN